VQQQKLRDLLTNGRNFLEKAGIITYILDAELLLMQAAEINTREDFLLKLNENISERVSLKYKSLIERRLSYEPLAQIIGNKEFWSLPFMVNSHVLTPRPETEHIIEQVLLFFPDRKQKLRLLDMGTGSGCIIISLLTEYPNASGIGVDISPNALAVAAQNAKQLGVGDRITWLESDWFENIQQEKFDIILSNPPYLELSEWQNLPIYSGIKGFEPEFALTDGKDGLDAYKILAASLPAYLANDGKAFLEFGKGQEKQLLSIFSTLDTKLIKDLAGIYRVIVLASKNSIALNVA
jgi:release factor glutamine methyltransferase